MSWKMEIGWPSSHVVTYNIQLWSPTWQKPLSCYTLRDHSVIAVLQIWKQSCWTKTTTMKTTTTINKQTKKQKLIKLAAGLPSSSWIFSQVIAGLNYMRLFSFFWHIHATNQAIKIVAIFCFPFFPFACNSRVNSA